MHLPRLGFALPRSAEWLDLPALGRRATTVSEGIWLREAGAREPRARPRVSLALVRRLVDIIFHEIGSLYVGGRACRSGDTLASSPHYHPSSPIVTLVDCGHGP